LCFFSGLFFIKKKFKNILALLDSRSWCNDIVVVVLVVIIIIIIIILDNNAPSVYLFESCYVCFNILYFCSLHFCTVARKAFRKQGRKGDGLGERVGERERKREESRVLLVCVRNSRRIFF
jgi:hypothetical protein